MAFAALADRGKGDRILQYFWWGYRELAWGNPSHPSSCNQHSSFPPVSCRAVVSWVCTVPAVIATYWCANCRLYQLSRCHTTPTATASTEILLFTATAAATSPATTTTTITTAAASTKFNSQTWLLYLTNWKLTKLLLQCTCKLVQCPSLSTASAPSQCHRRNANNGCVLNRKQHKSRVANDRSATLVWWEYWWMKISMQLTYCLQRLLIHWIHPKRECHWKNSDKKQINVSAQMISLPFKVAIYLLGRGVAIS